MSRSATLSGCGLLREEDAPKREPLCPGMCFLALSGPAWRCHRQPSIVVHPMLPTTDEATPLSAVSLSGTCGQREKMAPSDGQAAGWGFARGIFHPSWILRSCFPAAASFNPVAAGLRDRGRRCRWAPLTLPSPPALHPTACPQPSRGCVPFSVHNKPETGEKRGRVVCTGKLEGGESRDEGYDPGAGPSGDVEVWGWGNRCPLRSGLWVCEQPALGDGCQRQCCPVKLFLPQCMTDPRCTGA